MMYLKGGCVHTQAVALWTPVALVQVKVLKPHSSDLDCSRKLKNNNDFIHLLDFPEVFLAPRHVQGLINCGCFPVLCCTLPANLCQCFGVVATGRGLCLYVARSH